MNCKKVNKKNDTYSSFNELFVNDSENLQMVLNALPHGIVIINQDGFIKMVNACALQIIDSNNHDLIGQPVTFIFNFLNKEESLIFEKGKKNKNLCQKVIKAELIKKITRKFQ